MPAITCPNCRQGTMAVFHTARAVPSNSCIQLPTREEALAYPRGDIELGFCAQCGFISNTAFDKKLTEYSGRYEETQGFSPTFQRFHADLSERLIERFDLRGKSVLEIGCGKGEFLMLLCEQGQMRGYGFDPAYVPERNTSGAKDRVEFIRDFYGEEYSRCHADFVCCKMTLEHIHPTAEFVTTVRRAIGDEPQTTVFFMIPETTRILVDCAFEDVYYEHCSYFTPGSLARLFRDAGFEVLETGTEYADQYLTIAARPCVGEPTPADDDEGLAAVADLVASFPARLADRLGEWRQRLERWQNDGKTVVLWGSGSKAASFLATLDAQDAISCAVDINPYRQGHYMGGSGLKIVAPDDLVDIKPDAVVIMNAVYRGEIGTDLSKRGLEPEIHAL